MKVDRELQSPLNGPFVFCVVDLAFSEAPLLLHVGGFVARLDFSDHLNFFFAGVSTSSSSS